MIEYRPCVPEDMHAIQVQSEQQPEHALMIGYAEIVRNGMNFAGYDGDRCLAIGGVVPKWPGTGKVWCLLAADIGHANMLSLTRFTRNLFVVQPYRRLETSVLCGFEPAHRWVRDIFGWKLEAERMVGYDPAGRDCSLYALVWSA